MVKFVSAFMCGSHFAHLFFFSFLSRNNTRPILIPLPYIRSDIGLTTPAKQQYPSYHVPYIYSNRNSKAVMRHSHTSNKTAVPAVINFNPMNIPELSRPGTKNGPLTGGAITPLHATTNVAAEGVTENSIPAPFVSPGPYKGTTPNQSPALVDNKSDLCGKLDIESVDSDTDYPSRGVTGSSPDNKHDAKEEEVPVDQMENKNTENVMEVIVTRGIQLSLTTVGGVQGGVEIYDYDKRGRCIIVFNLGYFLSLLIERLRKTKTKVINHHG